MTKAMDKTRVYLKKIEVLDGAVVWLVDGEYIRKEIDENFTEFDHAPHFPFIPAHELWIDKDTDYREHRFFIDHFLAEESMLASGIPVKQAHDAADNLEAHERTRALSKKLLALKHHRRELIKRIHRDLLQEYSSSDVAVWLVDGQLVRDFFLIEYSEGGHDRVYPFIPEGEIWIEQVLSSQERAFIILHELHERFLMGGGKKYPEAHHGATMVEDYYRDHPSELEARTKEELSKNTAG
ncbi:MAG: hypothetical protein ACYC8S_02425 [Minisyncoccota bacterium]